MAKPSTHALSSARAFGGRPEDYEPVHVLLDSCREALPDNRGRALTHHSWFIYRVLPLVFGETIRSSDGRDVPTRAVAERHVMEDYGNRFIPTAQDFLNDLPFRPWMNNGKGQPPPSARFMNMSAMERYEAASRDAAEAAKAARELLKAAFAEAADGLFKAHPDLESFGYRQFTKYFNDGDACYFRAHNDEPDVNGHVGYDVPEELVPLQAAVADALCRFSDDDLQYAFGDHKEVLVTRDGGVLVSDYTSHD